MSAQSLFWELFFASIGGVVVFVGLLMEQPAEKKLFKTIRQFRRTHRIKAWGEWFVIGGVLIEAIVAICTANEEWHNGPRRQPIGFVAATVCLQLSQSSTVREFNSQSTDPLLVTLAFSKTNALTTNSLIIVQLQCGRMIRENDGAFLVMEFGQNVLSPLVNLQPSDTVESVKEWNVCNISLNGFCTCQTNCEILRGWGTLTINTTHFDFTIPSMRGLYFFGRGWGEFLFRTAVKAQD